MKKVTIFAVCLGLASLYLDTAESRKPVAERKTSQNNKTHPQASSLFSLTFEDSTPIFENLIDKNHEALLKDELAKTLFQCCWNVFKKQLQKNLEFIPSEYVDKTNRFFCGFIKAIPKNDANFSNMKELKRCLPELLRLKNAILHDLGAKKGSFSHPFINEEDPPLMTVVAYALQYINIEELEKINAILKKIIPFITDKANKRNLKQISQNLSDLVEILKSTFKLMDILMKAVKEKGDIDLLVKKKFPELKYLSKAAQSIPKAATS